MMAAQRPGVHLPAPGYGFDKLVLVVKKPMILKSAAGGAGQLQPRMRQSARPYGRNAHRSLAMMGVPEQRRVGRQPEEGRIREMLGG
jgi:hypothetical protein